MPQLQLFVKRDTITGYDTVLLIYLQCTLIHNFTLTIHFDVMCRESRGEGP